MTNKHLWIRRVSSLLFLLGVVVAGCGVVVDHDAGPQDAGPQDANTQCAAGEIFQYDDEQCGNVSSAGQCRDPAINCGSSHPHCGCDGMVYQSICEVHQGGVDKTFADQCSAPQGMFACGLAYCTRNAMFCHEVWYDNGNPAGFYCDPMPPECVAAPSCECFLQQLGYDECESDGMGGFYATEWVATD